MTTTNQALIAAQRAINSMKNEAETAAQGDEQMMLEACEEISKQGFAADTAIRAALDATDQPAPVAELPAEHAALRHRVSDQERRLGAQESVIREWRRLAIAAASTTDPEAFNCLRAELSSWAKTYDGSTTNLPAVPVAAVPATCPKRLGTRAASATDPEWKGRCNCVEPTAAVPESPVFHLLREAMDYLVDTDANSEFLEQCRDALASSPTKGGSAA